MEDGDRGQAAIVSRDRGLTANRVVKGHLVFPEDIPQEAKCLETHPGALCHGATLAGTPLLSPSL